MPATVKFNRKTLIGAAFAALFSTSAFAIPTFDASETTTSTGVMNHVATLTMQNTAPASIAAFDFTVTYDAALLTATTADITVVDPASNPGVVCQILVAGSISCFASHPTSFYPGDVQMQVAFDVGATESPDPGTPLTWTANSLTDNNGAGVAATPAPDDGAIIITGAPVPTPPNITSTYTPNGAAAGVIGATVVVGNIDFTIATPAANGGTGSIACVDTDTGNPPVLTINPANQAGLTTTVADATVSCGLTAAVQNGSVQCTLVNGGVQTFAVTCPAGSVVPPTPVPPTPAIIPASSMWSQLSLIGLLAALGLLVVALRRNH